MSTESSDEFEFEAGDKGNCFLLAAAEGKNDTLRYLHCLDSNLWLAKNDDNDTALTLASKFGFKETVELLINEFGVDIYETGFRGRNCFLSAAEEGNIDIIKYLHCIDENLCRAKDEDSQTSLTLACRSASKETVELLLDVIKVDIYETGFRGRNCFLSAAEGGKFDTMQYLFSKNKNLCREKDEENDTALTLASRSGTKETVEFLIGKVKLNIQETGFVGRNCFLRAAVGGKHETLKYLHSVDATLCKAKDIHNDTALTLACRLGDTKTVKLIIEEVGVSIYETGHGNWNCFLAAVVGGKNETIKYLHSIDASLCLARDVDNKTSMELAMSRGHKTTVAILADQQQQLTDGIKLDSNTTQNSSQDPFSDSE